MSLAVGVRLGPYAIISQIGAGGMGEVYRARDTRLDRLVAIKTVAPQIAEDPIWRERFAREARAISGLNHPHICTLYDVGQQDGIDFLVLEHLEGETLADRLQRGPLPVADTLRIGTQVAAALAEAHRHDLIHRDIKPANIFITGRGNAKVLDFGLAKALPGGDSLETGTAMTEFATLTNAGSTMGTIAYMSPEQLRGLPVDRRTDLFSLGIILYEMVTQARPFQGSGALAIADSILHAPPRAFGDVPAPSSLKSLIQRLLEKEPDNRYATADDVESALLALQTPTMPPSSHNVAIAAWVVAAIAILAIGTVAGRLWWHSERERWALGTAAPEIAHLEKDGEFVKAIELIRQAREILPKDETLEKLWIGATAAPTLNSVPPGAEVAVRPARDGASSWQVLGTTPLKDVRLTRGDYVWKVEKSGFAPIVLIETAAQARTTVKLWPEAAVPAGMVPVEGRGTNLQWPFGLANSFRPADYLIDQHEVTNEEYKRFVDAGGYEKREYWTEPFVRDGQTIPWEKAVEMFRDRTGRPGPSTWEVGEFPKGLAQHPVAGVSWYEAAAYSVFVGKMLPTVYHWTNASQSERFGKYIAPNSNFSGSGTVPAGPASRPSGFGTTDMAGNVKEWCSNAGSREQRFILGGGFGEDDYMFNMMDAQSAWARRANYGFRDMKVTAPPPAAATAPLELEARDVWKDKIVSDEVFDAFRGLYAYDRSGLNATVEETESNADWTRERITFDAGYGHERVTAHLFIPKHATPPYQTVLFFPSAAALLSEKFSPAQFVDGFMDFLLKSGRAVIAPIFKGTFERRDDVKGGGPGGNPPVLWRDHVIAWSKDAGRSLDYLETRTEFDHTKTAYFGYSLGGATGPVLLAVEPRFKTAILSSGGFWFKRGLPEVDGTNFVPRVKIPTLMLNGRFDHLFPVESGQLPLFRRIGVAEADKKHLVYDAGHAALPHAEEVRESLDWLDKYLGVVKR